MANVLSMVGVKNHPSRSGFDLSRKNLFTAKLSEILPAAVIECIPGDKFTIKPKWMTRTQPLNSAAYTRVKEYFNWYYVPTNLLWNRFNDFITNMKNNNLKADSISSSTTLSDQHPYVTLSQIWDYVNVLSIQGKTNFFGYDRARLTCKLLEYLGYGDFYGALYDESSTEENTFPEDRVDAVVNIFPLLAYQKIYQDHIRDSQWEKAYAPACNINYMTGSSSSLNIPLGDIDTDVENMFDLRYSNWNKDYFMGVLPNSQYGDVASIVLNDTSSSQFALHLRTASGALTSVDTLSNKSSTNNYYNDVQQTSQSNTLLQYFTADNVAALRNAMGFQYGNLFTILSLRQAEAVQKMREVMQSHEQDYKSQVEARWNVSVSDAYSDRCKWLGGDSSNIDISEVVNQNLTGGNNAQIQGKAVGIGDGFVKCNVDVHGYLVCLYHAVPVLDFSINGVKKHNLKTLFTDYAQPELDKTGMVSLPTIELINRNVPSKFLNTLIGYVPQYYEYKTAYDECHGGFYITSDSTSTDLKAWISPLSEIYIKAYLEALVSLGTNEVMTYYFLKVPPSIMDDIFGIPVNSDVSTDQLLINSYFDIKCARNLDYNGLPY